VRIDDRLNERVDTGWRPLENAGSWRVLARGVARATHARKAHAWLDPRRFLVSRREAESLPPDTPSPSGRALGGVEGHVAYG
jgi:hypothetical protein